MIALEMMEALEMNALEMNAEEMNALEMTEVVSCWKVVDLIVKKKSMMLFLSIWGAVENALEFLRGRGRGSLQTLAS